MEDAMARELPPTRRVVTGTDADGRSRFVADGPTAAVKTVPERPGYRAQNVWTTHGNPAPIADPERTGEIEGVMPPKNGTVLRIIDFPPESQDPAERERMMRATFASIYRDAAHRPETGHPGMHTTESVDYAIVLYGEIYARMDEGETLLRTGDVLIQRGTNHAWANRSDDVCRVAFVLIDGKF
jgi:quercetin dioxygenase-like cupin family protein